MFFIAVALMSSIGEIWWEEKKTQTNKQTNKQDKQTTAFASPIGDVCT